MSWLDPSTLLACLCRNNNGLQKVEADTDQPKEPKTNINGKMLVTGNSEATAASVSKFEPS